MPQITQPQTLTTSNASITTRTSIAGDLSFGTYTYPAYGALLAPASLGPVNLLNQGFVTATGSRPGALQAGILLAAGGTLTNQGTITGFTGIYLSGGNLTNSGAIISTATTSGTVKNAGILSNNQNGHLSINNSGLIAAAYFGIALAGSASITNGGTIRASFAVGNGILIAGGSITNHGLITGGYLGISLGPNSADAISNTGTINAATPARPFHPHIGTGIGLYSTITNNLTNSATGLISGAVTGIRTGGSATTIINAGTIAGATDAIARDEFITSTGNISIEVIGSIETFIATPLACFAAGTRILTNTGQVPVESLNIGNPVITADGTEAPIKWIGRRTINHPLAAARPIRISAGAIADNVPARDLYLSPDHALYFENHLIPTKTLLNHRNVTQIPRQKITYFHIELANHSIIFAENTACETYLETGNRSCFENAPITALHPDCNPAHFQPIREAKSCAPIAESGPLVERLRTTLLDRAFNNQNRPNPVIARPQSGRSVSEPDRKRLKQ